MVTADYPHLPVQPAPDGIKLNVLSAKLLPLVRQSYVPGCAKNLNQWIGDFHPTVLHDNGLWLTLNHQAARAASRHRLPLLLSPRGCLDPWALDYRKLKKKVALALYQRKDLRLVTCFHATSELEAESIRKMGLTQPIAIIPNGVELPEAEESGKGGEGGKGKRERGNEQPNSFNPAERDFRHSVPSASNSLPRSGTRYALFIGRLHPVKNLPTLLRAWADVKPEGWILRIAGTDEEDHLAELQGLVRELKIQDRIEFLGPVYGKEKEDLLRGSELAFLVSHSENFGISVVEALAYGIPVIASKTTPWQCLEKEGMGWWVEVSMEGIATGIRSYLKTVDVTKIEMSEKARAYTNRMFTWEAISSKFQELYAWMGGNEKKPNFIEEP
jgi:glycosyltransferase involved in cell wall biosynthesis